MSRAIFKQNHQSSAQIVEEKVDFPTLKPPKMYLKQKCLYTQQSTEMLKGSCWTPLSGHDHERGYRSSMQRNHGNLCFQRIKIFSDFHTPTFHTHLLAQRGYAHIVKRLKEPGVAVGGAEVQIYSLLGLIMPFIQNVKQTRILHSILTNHVIKMRV